MAKKKKQTRAGASKAPVSRPTRKPEGAKSQNSRGQPRDSAGDGLGERGSGGEVHQRTGGDGGRLSNSHGIPIADDQNSLLASERGPTLLEDHLLRDKITHFDHERIPERVVHARGSAAHGFFQAYDDFGHLTRAAFLRNPKERTPVFVRFSTVVGSRGSFDTVRDVRGFATKFYTQDGVYDLVGNNIPVFFIQDALKFPDLVHAIKPEPDRGFPQATAAHDTFWDFASLMPETVNMLLWIMSDRTIPRSYRMMEGFGVNTFRMIDTEGTSRFVKFHWRPKQGSFSLVWDESQKLGGADPDFHRRDLWTAIEAGDYPEFELSVQVFTEEEADGFGFDVLDATKVVPEELVPLTPLGRMVLDRNPDDFFAETEQVAFCPQNLVPGIDFSNDPLLQGRAFSYLDTQLKRLGGPNFHEIPINRSHSPAPNFQRGGHMRMSVGKGRAAYEPNSFGEGPREDPRSGFQSHPERIEGNKGRSRSPSFADHYTQARQFWRSMTPPEQDHIVGAFGFELGKVDRRDIRARVLGHLVWVDRELASRVEEALGMPGEAAKIRPAIEPRDEEPSPALSLIAKAPRTLAGKRIGVLVTEGVEARLVTGLRRAAKTEKATLQLVAPVRGGVRDDQGEMVEVEHAIDGGPSLVFDAVVVAPSADGVQQLSEHPAALQWVQDAHRHLKVIGHGQHAGPLLAAAGVAEGEAGVVALGRGAGGIAAFVDAAKGHRVWDREARAPRRK